MQSPTCSPLYQQIKALIVQSLEQGEWKPGEIIPSEVELAQRYGVSQGTVRKAIDELALENLVVRRQGKGTFVATHNEVRSQYRFLRLMPNVGEPSYPSSRVVECKRIRCPNDISRLLDVKQGDSVIFIKRVLSFDQQPIVLDEIWLPGNQFKGLTSERLQNWQGTLYGFFESEFGVQMIQASEKITAVAANQEQSDSLGVPASTPLLFVERISKTYADKPVEVRRGCYVTNHYHYMNVLN